MNLTDKVIVVTGGSGLLGSCIIERIEEFGGIAVNADVVHETDLSKNLLKLDITSPANIEAGIALVIEHFGRLDGVVNNAYPRTKDWGNHFEDIKRESWDLNVDYQLNSCFQVCQTVCRYFKKENPQGTIVNISSIYGVVGPDFSVYDNTPMTMPAAYSAIKGGVINFTKYLASYYGACGIRVNCVSPGGIFDRQPEAFVKQYGEKTPLKRMGLPKEIAGPVCFLLSDQASYITGHNLIVDGGWTSI